MHGSEVDFMIVLCPPGLGPGDMLSLSTPRGLQFTATIPEGTGPGDQMEVGRAQRTWKPGRVNRLSAKSVVRPRRIARC